MAVYGPAKGGKSAACALAASGPGGMIFSDTGAVLPVSTIWGVAIPSDRISSEKNIGKIAQAVSEMAKGVAYVDDLSILVSDKLSATKKQGWGAYDNLQADVYKLLDAGKILASKGGTLIMSLHEAPPKLVSGRDIRGGPDLWGQMAEKFSARVDTVLRVVPDSSAAPWPWVLHSRPTDYVGGDRSNTMPHGGPLNIGEALRAAEFFCPYPVGCEWMVVAVPAAARRVYTAGMEDWRKTLGGIMQEFFQKKPDTTPGMKRLFGQNVLNRASLIAHANNVDFWSEVQPSSSDGI